MSNSWKRTATALQIVLSGIILFVSAACATTITPEPASTSGVKVTLQAGPKANGASMPTPTTEPKATVEEGKEIPDTINATSDTSNSLQAREDNGGDDQARAMLEKREPKYPALGSHLGGLVASVETGETTAEEAATHTPVHSGGSIAVTIHLSGNADADEVAAFLEKNGGDPRNMGEDYIEAYVPVSLLGPASERPGVIRVREIIPPEPGRLAGDQPGTAASTPAPGMTSGPTMATPAPSSTLEPAPPGPLVPLVIQDPQGLLSALSKSELFCIGGDPEILTWTLTLAGPGMAPKLEKSRLMDCLDDETVTRLFMGPFLPRREPLSLQTSGCIREALEVINPRETMTAGILGDSGKAMAGSMAAFAVTVACLTDEEWESAEPELVMTPEERAGMQCFMEVLGGPARMAKDLMTGDTASADRLVGECWLDVKPRPETTTPAATTAR